MGVEMIKDRFGEDQLVLSSEDFYNDDIMGEKMSNYDIMKVIRSDSDRYQFVAKVMSKKNSKIYVIKQLKSNINQDEVKSKFQILNQLNHPNIIKYFKSFVDNGSIYIVKEYVDNGGLNNLKEAYSSITKPIEINTLWNIFMQCIAGLQYLHDNNILHGNLTIQNILMNENKVIKLDDIQINQTGKTKADDIKEMGEIFNTLISIGNNKCPAEMQLIVKTMLYNSQNTDARQLFKQIMDQYIKNVAKVSSINAIFRCMSSFMELVNLMFQNQNGFSEMNTPVAYYYMNCLKNYMNNEDPKNIVTYYNQFRNLLYRNSQMNNDVEIRPRQVLEFFLERLNKETGANYRGASFGTQNAIYEHDKELALQKFQQYFYANFNSFISNFFVGYIKTKRICNVCNQGFYSFNIHPFIEFDMDMNDVVIKNANGIAYNLNYIQGWFDSQNNQKKVLTKDHKIFCQNPNCVRSVTEHREFKQFYFLPKCFIISLNRGNNYNITFQPQIPLQLQLTEKEVESKQSPRNFNLVGIVKRILDANKEEYFIAIYLDRNKNKNEWKLSDRDTISIIPDPFAHKEGLTIVLFYSAVPIMGY